MKRYKKQSCEAAITSRTVGGSRSRANGARHDREAAQERRQRAAHHRETRAPEPVAVRLDLLVALTQLDVVFGGARVATFPHPTSLLERSTRNTNVIPIPLRRLDPT